MSEQVTFDSHFESANAVSVQIVNETETPLDLDRLSQAVQAVLDGAGIERYEISVAVVDDPTIHALNVRHLQHDYPTDVLSFLLEQEDDYLEGEIVASADTAAHEAKKYAATAANELLLYVVHGALHLVGYDDHSEADRQAMRAKEREYLARFGVSVRWE
jgi:probable rRNA maturation factor